MVLQQSGGAAVSSWSSLDFDSNSMKGDSGYVLSFAEAIKVGSESRNELSTLY